MSTVKSRILIAWVLAMAGCAPAASAATSATTPVATPDAPVRDAARAAVEAERSRNRSLSVQLGLARAEVLELRGEVDLLREEERRRVTRITQPQCEAAPAEELAEEIESASSGPRLVLRLYGTAPSPNRPAASARGVAVLPGPDAPAFVGPPPAATARLPVSLSEGDDPRAGVPAIPEAPISVSGGLDPLRAREPPPDQGAVRQYRAALSHLRDRRIPDAIAGLDAFLRDHATHPYADNAMYWRAEIDYTRRDYSSALARFARLLERYPRGNKVPDALLRIGLCYERMGQRSRARRVFSRLRRQYPDTVAARMASREDV